jgi:osmotically-inducible protein OsmY
MSSHARVKWKDHDRSQEHEIAEAAGDRLRNSPYAEVRDISCQCDRGMLFLRGRLSTFYHKQVAQEAVAGLAGVRQVVNEIEVAVLPT